MVVQIGRVRFRMDYCTLCGTECAYALRGEIEGLPARRKWSRYFFSSRGGDEARG